MPGVSERRSSPPPLSQLQPPGARACRAWRVTTPPPPPSSSSKETARWARACSGRASPEGTCCSTTPKGAWLATSCRRCGAAPFSLTRLTGSSSTGTAQSRGGGATGRRSPCSRRGWPTPTPTRSRRATWPWGSPRTAPPPPASTRPRSAARCAPRICTTSSPASRSAATSSCSWRIGRPPRSGPRWRRPRSRSTRRRTR